MKARLTDVGATIKDVVISGSLGGSSMAAAAPAVMRAASTAALSADPTAATDTAGDTPASRRLIRALPYTIKLPGKYALSRSLSTAEVSGTAITIEADDVVLDLAGFTLNGSAVGSATHATGVGAVGRRNLTIRNGTIRGFARGVALEDSPPPNARSSGHIVEKLRVEGSSEAGIIVVGADVVVRGNRVSNTGDAAADSATTSGVAVVGPHCRILENAVVGTCASGVGVAIRVEGGAGAIVTGNRVETATVGIELVRSEDVLLELNRITDAAEGLVFGDGSTGKYRGNLTTGVGTSYVGGTDAGGND